jgi:hypothetical protein
MSEPPAEQPESPAEQPEPPAEPLAAPTAEPAAPAVAETPAAQPASTPLQLTADQRKAQLDATLANLGAQGWRIENRSDFQATIAKGNRTNHVLHLILTIVTLGLWAIVWILMAILGGEKRRLVTVDPYGNVANRKV